jgi:hypothetical protein
MQQAIKSYLYQYPLRSVLFLAFITHLAAAVFSGGYAMHDDHFLIVETSGSWVDGKDYNDWLPSTQKKQVADGIREKLQPQGHSFVYPGFHYLIFSGLHKIGLDNPKAQMLIIRLIHVFLSLWAVFLAFKITEYLSDKKTALIAGIVFALSWSLPFLSVRNLVEMACIPFLLWGVYLIAKYGLKNKFGYYLLAGVAVGLAFTIRYQLAVYIFFMGLVFLFQGKWKIVIGLTVGCILSILIFQGLLDYLLWGYPFAEFIEYVRYNASSAKADYANDLGKTFWFSYIFVLGLMTVPILGMFWIFGVFYKFKRYLWISLPVVAFVAFHSIYINRQERFVFPVVYLVVILGIIGWKAFYEKSKFWQNRPKLWKGILIASWTFNTLFLIVLTTDYSKQSRVESAYFLYDKSPVNEVIQENTYRGDTPMIPRYYAGKWDFHILSITTPDQLNTWKTNATNAPDYVFFYGEENIKERVQPFQEKFPKLHFITTIEPSFFDVVLVTINPLNKNERIIIYGLKG